MQTLTLCLAGDVMTGRGVDQIQQHPGVPLLHEQRVHDARDYVDLAQGRHGPVPAPVAPDYIWGDALAELAQRQPRVSVMNLETAITRSSQAWPDKGVHYRMNPANVGCLQAARLGCWVLANNHVLDWGRTGLRETLQTLQDAGQRCAGAGRQRQAAWAPARLPLDADGQLLVFAWAIPDCGVPEGWAATATRSGVALLPDLSERSARRVAEHVAAQRQRNDRVLVSLHWGDNWGLDIPAEQQHFAHRLIELGAADLLHGHSSHHPRGIEVYQGHLILYGCGDLINDYEGIEPHLPFDASATCLYFAELDRSSGRLQSLELVPLQLRRLRLQHADAVTRQQLHRLLNPACRRLGTDLGTEPARGGHDSWQLHWPA